MYDKQTSNTVLVLQEQELFSDSDLNTPLKLTMLNKLYNEIII